MRTRVRRSWSGRERERVLARYAESGLSQREFCEQAGVALSTLGRWIRMAAKPEHEAVAKEETVFMEAFVENRAEQGAGVALGFSGGDRRCFKVSLRSGREIEVASGFNPGELAVLLRIVEER